MIVVSNLNSLNSLIRRSLILKAVASLVQNHRRAIIAPFSQIANTTEGQSGVSQLAEKSCGQTHFAVNVGLHVLSRCEVGGHLQGFKKEGMDVQPLVDEMLAGFKAVAVQNYLNVFHSPDTSGDVPQLISDVVLVLRTTPREYCITGNDEIEPQLVLWEYSVRPTDCAGEGTLLIGSLHIRTPTNTTVSYEQRKRITKLAKTRLETYCKKRN